MSHVTRKHVYVICEQQRRRSACTCGVWSAHPRSLISAFVVRCLDSRIPLVSISEVPILKLASEVEQTGFSWRGLNVSLLFLWSSIITLAWLRKSCSNIVYEFERSLIEPRHENTCLRGVRPGKTQTGLLSYRDWLGFWNLGYNK